MKRHLLNAAGAVALAATLLFAAGCSAQHSDSDSAGSGASAAAGGASSSASGATGATGSGQSPQARGRMGQVLLSLDLTDDQKAKIKQIMADTRKQNEAVTDRAEKRANFRLAFQKVEAVLTPDQQAKFKAKMAAMRAAQAPAPDQTPQ